MSASQTKSNYPCIIQDKPCGSDKSEGKSQTLITEAIKKYIRSTDGGAASSDARRIIGLEGGWGTGKSNVIKQLEKSLDSDYYFFLYDAWGHQEDLQRRSFLELLTSELIDKQLLVGEIEITTINGGKKTVPWSEKLKYLLARKTETKTEKYPLLNKSMVAILLATVFTPIFVQFGNIPDNGHWLSYLLPIVPTLLMLVFIVYDIVKNKRDVNYIFALYNGKIESDVCYETINENEPTVIEFKKWMQNVNDNIRERKLIIVFDNMDRLPAEKVKQLWSSIHTFFSEGEFKNIWVIIPFDKNHLELAFDEENDKKEETQLTKHFINKTFPVVYEVRPPIITDFKKIFFELYEEAFGDTEFEYKEELCRIFRYETPKATIRQIIIFINDLVILKSVRGDEIDLLSIAIFVIKKDEIMKDPINQILSGDYLQSDALNTILNNEILQKNISALAYSVSLEDAEQIPISGYIDRCLGLVKNEVEYVTR